MGEPVPAIDYPWILDGHEDFVNAIPWQKRDFLVESDRGHVDLPRARRGGLGGAFVSVYLTDQQAEQNATGYVISQIDDFLGICDRSQGQVRLVTSIGDFDQAMAEGAFAGILHFEGADAISRSLKELRVFYKLGLRSLGVVWSRPTIFGSGVSFTGPQPAGGLTETGLALVAECNRLGILLDVSHLNPAGFWDLVRATERPFAATHSNCQAISPHVRNLSDDQIRAIAEKDGTIGLNFSTMFLRPDATHDADTPVDLIVDHAEHIFRLVGDRHVSIGSDYDGTDVPKELADASRLPRLIAAFRASNWTDDRIERVCVGNFRRVLAAVWR